MTCFSNFGILPSLLPLYGAAGRTAMPTRDKMQEAAHTKHPACTVALALSPHLLKLYLSQGTPAGLCVLSPHLNTLCTCTWPKPTTLKCCVCAVHHRGVEDWSLSSRGKMISPFSKIKTDLRPAAQLLVSASSAVSEHSILQWSKLSSILLLETVLV